MRRLGFAVVGWVLLGWGNGAAAWAQDSPHKLASGPMYGGSSQNSIDCYIVNVGKQPVTITAARLIGQYIGVVSNPGNCAAGVPLQPGQVCTFGVAISGGANACAIEAGSVRELRGSAQIRHTEPNGGSATTLVDEAMQ